MVPLPEKAKDLLNKPIIAVVTTVMPSGQPQSTAVWVDYEDGYFRVNTARGRQKDRNMQRNAKVTLFLLDPKDPYHYAEIRGHVSEITEEGANAHIDKLAQKYTGALYKNHDPKLTRVIYKITPDRIRAQ
ncbi:MAG TPA: PPOX class F420-dependent oxidoreductase [Aggregatilineaceae bacterium]|nr:PPOX class F420-dependent oxidoreductase [Aggregatilineaceae bacterium]